MAFGSSPIELLATDAMLRGAIFCNGFTNSARWLTGTQSALGASATVDQIIQISSEADFVVQRVTFTAFSALDTLIVDPDYTILIAISSGRPWFDSAQTLRDFCGNFTNGHQPNDLPMPRLIPAQSTLTITLANRTVTACNRASLALSGFNVYYQKEDRSQVFHAL